MDRNGTPGKQISLDAVEMLEGYAWNGNIRELEDAILGAVALADDIIYPEHLPLKVQRLTTASNDNRPLADNIVHRIVSSRALVTLARLEEKYAIAVLDQTGGNKQAAARILDIDRKTLCRIVDSANESSSYDKDRFSPSV